MFLQRLNEYVTEIEHFPPALYQLVPVRYVLRLDEQTLQAEMIDTATDDSKRGKERLAPDYSSRSSGIVPLLFADHAEYTLGIPRPKAGSPEKVLQRYQAYCALVAECASQTGERAVQLIAEFLSTLSPGHSSFSLPDTFVATERITFEVILADGRRVWPIDLPSVQAFWALNMSKGDKHMLMHCLVCDELRSPVKTLPTQIRGIPGEQATIALVSANQEAFESYGLGKSRIAPLCELCAHNVCTALNMLLRQPETHLRTQALAYVFWAPSAPDLPFGSMILEANPKDVATFLHAPWKGRPQALEKASFHTAALSSYTSRLVVRDWQTTTLDQASHSLQRYFRLQRVVDRSGAPRWFPLWQLAQATIRPESKDKTAPRAEAALLHVAFHGGPLPLWLLYQTLQCLRAHQLRAENEDQGMQPAHAALLKMVLLTQPDRSWLGELHLPQPVRIETQESEDQILVELDVECAATAYLCGRLFATLEEIEALAMGKISNDIVGGYFNTASTSPASVFNSLVRRAQPHLTALEKKDEGAYWRLENQLLDIFALFTEKTFPTTFSAPEQGQFAIGYYQQKAATRAARIAGWKAKQEREAQKKASDTSQPASADLAPAMTLANTPSMEVTLATPGSAED